MYKSFIIHLYLCVHNENQEKEASGDCNIFFSQFRRLKSCKIISFVYFEFFHHNFWRNESDRLESIHNALCYFWHHIHAGSNLGSHWFYFIVAKTTTERRRRRRRRRRDSVARAVAASQALLLSAARRSSCSKPRTERTWLCKSINQTLSWNLRFFHRPFPPSLFARTHARILVHL